VGARLVAVGDAELEVSDWGSDDPIVFLPTALVADELVPLANQPALDGFRKLLYHRRGCAGSRGVEHSCSITRDADDVRSWLGRPSGANIQPLSPEGGDPEGYRPRIPGALLAEPPLWGMPGAWTSGQPRVRAVYPGHSEPIIYVAKCWVPAALH
jgi:hypothetical protein